MIVENRPGAGGYAGSAYVARSTPDGQTLLVNLAASVHATLLGKELSVDVVRALSPLAILGTSPVFLWASGAIPARNLSELVAYARKNPKKLNFATFPNTIDDLLYIPQFLHAAGIDAVRIPYNSMATAVGPLLAGEVHLLWSSVNVFQPHLKSGKVVVLGVRGAERAEVLPEVPTFKEQGVNFEGSSQNYMVFGPLGLGPELLAQLNKRIYAAMNNPAAREAMLKFGMFLPKAAETPGELAAKFAKEVRETGEAAAQLGIKPK